VVRATRLKLAVLAGAVGVLHVVALEWIGREMDTISGLAAMAPVLFTRTLSPSEPPPVVAQASVPAPSPRPRAAPHPRPPASSPDELRRQQQEDEQAQEEARGHAEKGWPEGQL
jgi:hypothetical protein